jgi:hypothetical protein
MPNEPIAVCAIRLLHARLSLKLINIKQQFLLFRIRHGASSLTQQSPILWGVWTIGVEIKSKTRALRQRTFGWIAVL